MGGGTPVTVLSFINQAGMDLSDMATILSILYICTTLLVAIRIRKVVFTSPYTLDTKKLFVLSVFVNCVLRALSWIGIGLLCMSSIDMNSTSLDRDKTMAFIATTVYVMFDLPNYIILSAYVLLGLVWSEFLVRSRKHWLSVIEYRQPWLIAYLVFNICLYSTQLVLYILVFFHAESSLRIIDALSITVSCMNYGLPVAFGAFWLYYSIKFAGFPSSGPSARRMLDQTSTVMQIWTFGRIVWGVCFLTTRNLITRYTRDDNRFIKLAFVSVIIISEMWPFLAALHLEFLQVLSADYQINNRDHRTHNNDRDHGDPSTSNCSHVQLTQHDNDMDDFDDSQQVSAMMVGQV